MTSLYFSALCGQHPHLSPELFPHLKITLDPLSNAFLQCSVTTMALPVSKKLYFLWLDSIPLAKYRLTTFCNFVHSWINICIFFVQLLAIVSLCTLYGKKCLLDPTKWLNLESIMLNESGQTKMSCSLTV